MNTEKFVVGIRRQLLRNKRNYFACCPNVKTNSCMEMNVLNSHRNIFKGIKEQIDTITNSYNKWLYLFLNILFATCYHNNVYISFHFHMGMDHFFRVSYLLQRLLPLSYLVQNQLFE